MVTGSGNMRMTRQRQVILEELTKVTSQPTADELYLAVRRRLQRISLGTVYRNLEVLSQAGKVLRLRGGAQRRFDAMVDPHYHVRCCNCGKVEDLPMQANKRLDSAAAQICDYSIDGHWLEFSGLCPTCQRTAAHE